MSITLPAELRDVSDGIMEEWFLAHAQDSAIPFEPLAAILCSFQSRGHTEKAEACADLLIDTLDQHRAEEYLLALLELRAEWHAESPAFAAVCGKKLGAFFQNNTRMETLIRNAAFDHALPASECLRRFRVLRGLQPGALCYEKTWGVGTVIDIAEFDQLVRIDFEKKKGHRLALAYAAHSLLLLSDDHLLAKPRRDPAAAAAWVRNDPAGVVKSALQSFGPLNVQGLQELLLGRLVPEGDWKRFWDTARKQLKADPRVAFPTKRNDPIRILAREIIYDDAWLAALDAECELNRILDKIEEWKNAVTPGKPDVIPPSVHQRLVFVIHGADKSQAAVRAHALILADELGIFNAMPDAADHATLLFAPETIVDAVHHLPVARIERLFLFMHRRNAAQTADRLLAILPQLALPPFNEALDFLRHNGVEARVIETLRLQMAAGNATPEMIYWLCRHETFTREHGLCSMGRLALEALNAVEATNISGERLKAKNQIRSLIEQSDWLPAVFPAWDDLERRHFISRLKNSPAWSTAERHALIHRLTQSFPELISLLTEETPPPAIPRSLTSLRSYQERQAQLHKLIMVDIPQNSQDIATARGYGDLRENFEYKSARETQGILMRRRHELEMMLSKVRSTDFEGFPNTAVGMGTRATLVHADGRKEQYVILGEWDSDEELAIISSKSKLAEALIGHHIGDQVIIPTENGSTAVTLTEVSGLPDTIKTWIRGA